MQFELTKALIDDILFSMEDQNGEFLLDTREGMVVNTELDEFMDEEEENADGGEDRFISLPDWGPSDGFRLMERFTAALRGPVVREALSAALDRSRGVFRAFKDAVAQYPETEKRWFDYKEREMRREVIRWYNGLREEWGMELIGEEPEDLSGLALEDFRFRDGTASDRKAAEDLHRVNREGGEGKQGLAAEIAEGINQGTFPGDLCIVGETAGGDFAGYISAVYSGPSFLHIRALEVRPEYRGLSLGGTLLSRLLEKADRKNIDRVSIDLPAGAENFSRVLLREAFQPCVQRFCRSNITIT